MQAYCRILYFVIQVMKCESFLSFHFRMYKYDHYFFLHCFQMFNQQDKPCLPLLHWYFLSLLLCYFHIFGAHILGLTTPTVCNARISSAFILLLLSFQHTQFSLTQNSSEISTAPDHYAQIAHLIPIINYNYGVLFLVVIYYYWEKRSFFQMGLSI